MLPKTTSYLLQEKNLNTEMKLLTPKPWGTTPSEPGEFTECRVGDYYESSPGHTLVENSYDAFGSSLYQKETILGGLPEATLSETSM